MGSRQRQLAVAAMFAVFLLSACSYSNRTPDKLPPADPPAQPGVTEKTDTTDSSPIPPPQKEVSPQGEAVSKPASTPAITPHTQTTPKTHVQRTPAQHATPAAGKPETPVSVQQAEEIKPGSLQGTVQISGKKNKTWKPSNVIATLRALDTVSDKKNAPATHEVDMKNKTYHPVAQTILKGDSLRFNNHDNIKHNVFSSSGDNTFDLGTFEGSGSRTVALQHTGIVKVYCNIHPEMATFVMVAENPYNAISNRKGEFIINNIPPGKYMLSLWHIRGELQTEIEIKADTKLQQDFNIDGSRYQRTTHLNKFGEEYEKKPALFEDEFY